MKIHMQTKKMCHNIIMMVYDNWDNHRHHHHCLIACCMISDSSSYILIHNNVDGKKFLWNFFFESSSSLCLSWNIIHLVLYIPKKEGNSKVHTNTQTHNECTNHQTVYIHTAFLLSIIDNVPTMNGTQKKKK